VSFYRYFDTDQTPARRAALDHRAVFRRDGTLLD
jgi:hypothetical protein